jgi:outer membrane protein OmpA-like peptidoglycan-associated protein
MATGYLLFSMAYNGHSANITELYGRIVKQIGIVTTRQPDTSVKQTGIVTTRQPDTSVKQMGIVTTRQSDTSEMKNPEQRGQDAHHGNDEQEIRPEAEVENPSAAEAQNSDGEVSGTAAVGQQFPMKDLKLVVPFGLNTNEISPKAYALLDGVAAVMLRSPDAKIIIRGYTDALGAYKYNKRLSMFRANIVKSYFVGKGVSPERVYCVGMGDKNPLEPNTTSKGRAANRRVEIQVALMGE